MLLEFDGTFIFATFSFIIFVILMNLILYRPIVKIMDERQKFFDKNKDTVSTSKQKAEDILKQKDAEILSAKLEAADILTKTGDALKIQRENAISDKKNEIEEKNKTHIEAIKRGRDETKTQLKSEIKDFVKMSVSKILDDDINDINISDEIINKAMEGQK